MLHVHALAKFYAGQVALQPVSFHVTQGEIVGVLGPEGAGKTTLLQLLAGCLQPDAGSISIAGIDALANPHDAQARLGYLPAHAPAWLELSVQTHLRLVADLRGIAPAAQRELLSQTVYATQLEDHLAEAAGRLRRGVRQRLGLAQAILHRPPLLLLDEPFAGLDEVEAAAMRYLIKRLAQRSAVLLATGVAEEVETLCDRALLLLDGSLRADVRLAELRASAGAVVVLDAPVYGVAARLRSLPGVRRITAIPSDCGYPAYHVSGAEQSDLCPAIFALASAQGWPLRELRPDHQTLRGVLAALSV
jgi:ABC-2 type transport system ATP-binding protein